MSYKVTAPVGKRKDGEWSRAYQVMAIFREQKDAEEYATTLRQRGIPVRIVGKNRGRDYWYLRAPRRR